MKRLFERTQQKEPLCAPRASWIIPLAVGVIFLILLLLPVLFIPDSLVNF